MRGEKNGTIYVPLPHAFERAYEAECWGEGGAMRRGAQRRMDAQRETLNGLMMVFVCASCALVVWDAPKRNARKGS